VIGYTCMLLCGFLRVPFAQQTAGASWHPAFPAPSWLRGQSDEAKLGRNPPRGCEGMSASNCSQSSPGLTGRSSTPRRWWLNREAAAYWSPRPSAQVRTRRGM